MATRLKITKTFIKSLVNSNSRRRKVLLKNATNEELKGLFELCLNIIRGNLPIDKTAFQNIKRHKRVIESLSNRRLPIYKKREIINQKGGFIGTLAAFALPLLTHLLSTNRK